jgi:hypothetical protein
MRIAPSFGIHRGARLPPVEVTAGVPLCGTYGGLPSFSGMNREVLITLCSLAFATLFAFAIAAALMIR